MNLFAITALFAVTTLQMPVSHAAVPIAASRPTASAQAQNQNANIYRRPFFPPQPQELSVCRLRAFFGSDAARPLETIYFARQGSPCAGNQFYGFVFLNR